MDNTKTNLNPQEEHEMREGMALYEMTQSEGWKIIEKWLQDRAFHTWADPRETTDPNEWQWRELNAFHASNNAQELLENISRVVDRSDYLQKVKSGAIQKKGMRF